MVLFDESIHTPDGMGIVLDEVKSISDVYFKGFITKETVKKFPIDSSRCVHPIYTALNGEKLSTSCLKTGWGNYKTIHNRVMAKGYASYWYGGETIAYLESTINHIYNDEDRLDWKYSEVIVTFKKIYSIQNADVVEQSIDRPSHSEAVLTLVSDVYREFLEFNSLEHKL